MGNLNSPLVLGTLLLVVAAACFGFTIGYPLPSTTRNILIGMLGIGVVLMIYGAFFYNTGIKKRGFSRNWEDQG